MKEKKGQRQKDLRRILIKDNHLFIMEDENILTGCKTNRSSFSGFVRLVPKMMNPVLMPAEWSALSKLRHERSAHMSLAQCKEQKPTLRKTINNNILQRCYTWKGCGDNKLHVRIKTYFEMNKAMTKSKATRMKKMPNKI